MDDSTTSSQVSAGDSVFASDGEKVGTVAAIHPSYLLVEKGVLFLTDYHVPISGVARYDADERSVHLRATADEALSSGWDQHPDDPEMDLRSNQDTLLTGAASLPDPGEVLAVLDEDDPPLKEQ